MAGYWDAWMSEDYTLDHCKEVAARLRSDQRYNNVRVDTRRPERVNGQLVAYGRVFVHLTDEEARRRHDALRVHEVASVVGGPPHRTA